MTGLDSIFNLNFDSFLQGPTLLLALAAFGFIVGILTGIFGVGGGFMITPMLSVAFGIPYGLAIGSGLCFTIGTSASGMSRHIRLNNFEHRSTVILALMSMIGAVLGATLNQFLSDKLGPKNYQLTMDILFVLLLSFTAFAVAKRNVGRHGRKSLLQRLPIPPRINLPSAGLTGISLPGLCLVGVFVGVVSGMMGIGGGVLFMPILILVVGLTAHQAVGTSLGVVMLCAIAGTIKYGVRGNVNLFIAMALLVSSVFGIQLGAWICNRLHAQKLQRYFAILVILVAASVAFRMVYELFGSQSGAT